MKETNNKYNYMLIHIKCPNNIGRSYDQLLISLMVKAKICKANVTVKNFKKTFF